VRSLSPVLAFVAAAQAGGKYSGPDPIKSKDQVQAPGGVGGLGVPEGDGDGEEMD
jgi:hypothetical protein